MTHFFVWVGVVVAVYIVVGWAQREPGENANWRGRLLRRRSIPGEPRSAFWRRLGGSLLLGTGVWIVIESGAPWVAVALFSWFTWSGWREIVAQPMCSFWIGLLLATYGYQLLQDRWSGPAEAPRGRPLKSPENKRSASSWPDPNKRMP